MKVEKKNDSIVGEVEINAAPEVVFAALTDPRQLGTWWGDDSCRTQNWQIDLRTGGKWSAELAGESPRTVSGVYELVDVPNHVIFTWKLSWENLPETRVEYRLQATATGTKLHLLHSGFGEHVQSQEDHFKGWTKVMGFLQKYCAVAAVAR